VPAPAHIGCVVVVSPPGDLHGLTIRELETLGLVIDGWSNPSHIAADLPGDADRHGERALSDQVNNSQSGMQDRRGGSRCRLNPGHVSQQSGQRRIHA